MKAMIIHAKSIVLKASVVSVPDRLCTLGSFFEGPSMIEGLKI